MSALLRRKDTHDPDHEGAVATRSAQELWDLVQDSVTFFHYCNKLQNLMKFATKYRDTSEVHEKAEEMKRAKEEEAREKKRLAEEERREEERQEKLNTSLLKRKREAEEAVIVEDDSSSDQGVVTL